MSFLFKRIFVGLSAPDLGIPTDPLPGVIFPIRQCPLLCLSSVAADYRYNLFHKSVFVGYILAIPQYMYVASCVFMWHLVTRCTVTMQPVVSRAIVCVFVGVRAVSGPVYLDQRVSVGALVDIQ